MPHVIGHTPPPPPGLGNVLPPPLPGTLPPGSPPPTAGTPPSVPGVPSASPTWLKPLLGALLLGGVGFMLGGPLAGLAGAAAGAFLASRL